MNKYDNITAEDRAIIVISINFKLSGEGNSGRLELYSILNEMFGRHPSISFFDFPLVFSTVQDFYYNLRNEDRKSHTELLDRDALQELKDNCEALLDKIRAVCMENGLELSYPS